MEDDDGPIAHRDFPKGCVRLTRRVARNPTRRPSAGALEAAPAHPAHQGDGELPNNFDQLSDRDKLLQRRALYSRLLEHYRSSKRNGEPVGFRPDLRAMKHMNKKNQSVDFQRLGDVPGVLVGDQFEYRTEMFVVGLHRQVQGGIACIEDGREKVACSVVVSGGYRDDNDLGETVEYTGQGGNDYKGDKRQLEDQKLNTGNQALINTFTRKGVVRLIRGHDGESEKNETYSYDGLYKVNRYDLEVGRDGHKVYTFVLKRLENQPPLKANPVKTTPD